MNIVLIGMPGSGKTTISRNIAKSAPFKRVDTDAEIVKKYGAISDIFENFGEQKFREIETETIAEISVGDNLVIATGGGAVLNNKNVELLKANGKIIFLSATRETILKRVSRNNKRPLLRGDVKANIEKLFTAREGIYNSVADEVVVTDGKKPVEIAKEILKRI